MSIQNPDEDWASLRAGDRLAKRLGRDPCAVSDVIVDTYMRCLQTHDESRGSFRAYYITCLRRELLRSKRKPMADMREGLKEFGHSVLQELISKEGNVDIALLVNRVLDDEERELLHDKFVEGMTLYEIGVKHGVLKQAIWARLQRIIEKLRGEV